MSRIGISLLVILLFVLESTAQNDNILLTIGSENISKAEFEYVYKKNNANLYQPSEKKSPEDYLDLYIDFKLKVLEAKELKMDTSAVFLDELKGYRKELAAPYLTDTGYTEELVKEMYRRMNLEVNASHILLRLDERAPNPKADEVLQRIVNIRKEILDGKNFGEAATEYSEDPSAKTNKGNLGYFSAFTMVYPFENAAFTTPPGEISQPFRSKFGYHIIQVHDIRKNQGEILVAHIMKQIPKDASAETKEKLKTEIEAIYQEVLNGADFAELAKSKSDDKRSAMNGGQMPWFAAGRIIAEFSEPAFALKKIGDVSEPIETPFGFHIIKKVDYKPVPSFQEAKADIENRIQKDPARNTGSQKAFIEKLKKEYNYQQIDNNVQQLLDSYELKAGNTDIELFQLAGTDYSLADFNSFATENNVQSFTNESFIRWVDNEILAYEDAILEEKHPNFGFLMQEYYEGILLFNISQEKIWNRASTDSTGLELFYEKNKKNHLWPERFKGSILKCETKEVRELAENLLAEGLYPNEVEQHINTDKKLITIEIGMWEQGSNPIVDYYVWNGPEPENFSSALSFIRGDKISPEAKTLNEARGLFISDYQDYLEKEWLKNLRKKYKIKVNKKLLKTISGV